MRLEWEYRIIEVDLDSPRAPQALNNAGRDGWEAITGTTRGSVDSGSAQHERLVVLLKRMKPSRGEREHAGTRRKKALAS